MALWEGRGVRGVEYAWEQQGWLWWEHCTGWCGAPGMGGGFGRQAIQEGKLVGYHRCG